MRIHKIIAAVAGLAALASSASAAPVMWAGNGHFYEYVGGPFSFASAEATAASMTFGAYEGYLATATSADENAFIGSLVIAGFGSLTQTWLGGSDRETEGVWKWISGPEAGTVFWTGAAVPGQYHNWATPQEPNNNGNEDGLSAFYFGNLQWNDLDPGVGNGFVVEYRLKPQAGVPEPGAWALMIAGFAIMGARLRTHRRYA
jgi:Lectin C-type domain